jgi:predicted RecB family nuclease
MYKSDSGALIVSPTDLTRFVGCEHRTSLDLQVVSGTRPKPPPSNDEVLELLFAKGNEHERKYLATLRTTRDVVEIPGHGTPTAERVAATDAAIRTGADVIYQAAFFHDGRVGYADFLLRADRPSELGHWSYDVADTKLARKLKVPALLQMASYGEHLRRLQGEPPVWLTVVAGDGQPHPFPFADVEAYARRLVGRFDGFVADPPVTVAEPVAECDQCSWARHCNAGWRAADHLSYVAFLGRGHRKLLEAADIRTMAELGTKTVDDLPSQINAGSRERILRQARLQLAERAGGHSHYELLEPAAGLGLLRLPAPDAADLYLDFEADRWVEPDGREFLAGIGDTTGDFEALWAHSEADEKQLTEDLIDHITVVWRSNPGMHVYHYAPYEKSALTRLVQRHATREAELDILLRAEVLVDLYAVVRQGMQVSKESYSIKKLEAFYWSAERRKNAEVAEAVSSTLYYEKWLLDNDPALLDAIEAYNKDDVDSTRDLHRWLEQRRAELCTTHGTASNARRRLRSRPPSRPRPSGPSRRSPRSSSRQGKTFLQGSSAGTGERTDQDGGSSSTTPTSPPTS